MPFQQQVNVQPAIGVAGDFASTNPRFSVMADAGALIAGPSGLTVGLFCWAQQAPQSPDSAPTTVNNFAPSSGPTTVMGFVHREQQALITTYLAEAGNTVPAGFGVTVMSGGDFLVKNGGTTQALPGQQCFAALATGQALFAATGTTPSTASVSGSILPGSASFTGSVSGDVLTVSSVASGTIVAGGSLSAAGMAPSTLVVSQLTGSLGLVGTYLVSVGEQTFASGTITEAYGVMTVATVITGAFGVGDTLSGTGGGGVTAATVITQLGTGTTGGVGTYYVNFSQSVTTATINASLAVATKWYAMSGGLPGELIKISDHVLG